MATLMSQPYANAQLEFEIERLLRLAHDLQEIRDGKHPTEEYLRTAPRLENWELAWRKVPCLNGYVFGHPHIADGDTCLTTEIWALAPRLGYARTTSRFYSLGSSLSAARNR